MPVLALSLKPGHEVGRGVSESRGEKPSLGDDYRTLVVQRRPSRLQ